MVVDNATITNSSIVTFDGVEVVPISETATVACTNYSFYALSIGNGTLFKADVPITCTDTDSDADAEWDYHDVDWMCTKICKYYVSLCTVNSDGALV